MLTYTLITDGSSDRALIPILNWLLEEQGVIDAIRPYWADLRGLRQPPRTLSARIHKSILLYPCQLLFIHRDAERELPENRRHEIEAALQEIPADVDQPPAICVIPIRMQETWLLLDQQAIRDASGNPNGIIPINLPSIDQLETLPDPKRVLHELLRIACDLKGHRRNKFMTNIAAARVTEYCLDFAPLRGLSAFNSLEMEIQRIVRLNNWN